MYQGVQLKKTGKEVGERKEMKRRCGLLGTSFEGERRGVCSGNVGELRDGAVGGGGIGWWRCDGR